MFTSVEDAVTFEETHKNLKWREAMDMEMKAIEKNKTWELITLHNRAKSIEVKWVFKTKLIEKGNMDKYKAKLVARDTLKGKGSIIRKCLHR